MDKTVKISVIADPSVDAATKKLKELVSAVEELTRATARLNLFGGGGGTGVGSKPTVPGAGSPLTNATHAASKMGIGGGAGAMTAAVANTAAAMKQSAQQGVGAFKEIDRAFQDFVFSADSRMRRFVGMVNTVGAALKTAKSVVTAASGGGDPSIPPWALQEERRLEWQQLSPMSKFKSFMTQGQPGLPMGQGGGVLGRIPWTPSLPTSNMGLGGQTLGGAGAGLALGAAIAAGVSKAMDLRNDNQVANLKYQMERPFMDVERRGTVGGVMGGYGLRLKQGDMALSMAMERASKSSDFNRVINGNQQGFRKWLIDKELPAEFMNKPTIGNAWAKIKEKVGSGVSDFTDEMVGQEIPGLSKTEVTKLANQMRKQYLGTEGVKDFQRYVDAEMQRNPVMNELVNRLYGGSQGRIDLARSAGMSGGVIRRPGQKPIDQLSALEARSMRAGYGTSEMVGMMGQVAGTAGRGLMHSGTTSLLSMTHGGLQNAVQLYGLGAQFGGGGAAGAGRFMKGLQSSIGRGGLDVTAASQVFGAGANMMTAGNFVGGTGVGFMSTIAQAAYSGTPGGDMLGARQVQAGLGAMSATFGGQIDPLQKGINNAAAIQAAGNLPPAVRDALLTIDPAMLLDMLASGNVPPELLSRFPKGTDPKQALAILRNYNDNVMKFSLARYSDKMGAGTGMGDSVAKFRQAGGLGYLSGIKGRKNRVAEMRNIAEAIHMSTGMTRDSAMGMLRVEAQAQGLLGRVRGKGAHQSASMDTVQGVANIDKALGAQREGEAIGATEGFLKTAAGRVQETFAATAEARVRAEKGVTKDPDQAVADVAVALTAFVNSLKGMNTRMAKAHPPRPAARQ